MTVDSPGTRTRLPKIGQFLLVVVGYLVIVQGLTLLLADPDSTGGSIESVDALLRGVIVPVALGAAFVVAIVAWVGGWTQIFVSARRLRRWTLVIPVLLLLGIIAVTNYGGLMQAGLLHALVLLTAVLLVGFAEELLFRGLGVAAFQSTGRSEFAVAGWTSLIFGIAHGSNGFITGDFGAALLQVVLTTLTGAVFYLVLRTTGSLVVGMAAHGLWDFGILSTQIDLSNTYDIVNFAPVLIIVLLLIVLTWRKRLARAVQDGQRGY
ncbi:MULTISPECIES: CPBP family intramembrane glutamic endopeptidase [unclassified Microbacterium]|uniref:CPBP family intramembrane glutamic endopeptidase n=1 Tax=unclassified Microbacterium TaxID=2609290 RepID=UPI0034361C3A